jgi:hypothetical protein
MKTAAGTNVWRRISELIADAALRRDIMVRELRPPCSGIKN